MHRHLEVSSGETLVDRVRSHARLRPRAPALVCGERRRTWSELDSGAARVAAALRRHGVKPGDRVALLGQNSAEWVETMVGILRARAVAVPLNQRLTPVERARVLDDASAAVLVADPGLHDGGFSGTCLPLGGLDDANSAVPGEGAAGPAADDLALIGYTSGTTGLPKGAMWSHRTLLASACCNPFSAGLAGGRPVLLSTPLGAAGAVAMAANSLAIGAALFITSFNPETTLGIIADQRIEFLGLVPTMIAMLVDAAPRGWRAPDLRRTYYGAGFLTPQLFRRASAVLGGEFQQGYGMTETCIFGTRLDPEDHSLERPELLASAGRPMPGVEVKIVDDQGAEAAAGTPGEIYIRSPGNMIGYWRREEETRRVIADGWYRSRDIGRWDANGYLYLMDRTDDMVKSGGFTVSPAEVEAAILAHPEVEEAAVIGVPDERWGERVAAVVRPRPGATITEGDLVAFCHQRLAGFKTPRTIFFAAAPLPRNALGKLVRQALRAQYNGRGKG